jgi:hypothetical protein
VPLNNTAMNFKTDDTNIEQSFNTIAKELINENVIMVNDKVFEFTEIEFYFFKKGIHEDIYTQKNKRNAGEWRVHNQGLEITLEANEEQYGSILIRGLKHESTYVNGPMKALGLLFESMGSAFNPATLMLKSQNTGEKRIIKTFRHIPTKIQDKNYHFKKYRYIAELELVDISNPIKNQIVNDCTELQ